MPLSAPASGRASPSPPSATTVSPSAAAVGASSRRGRCCALVTVRCAAPSRRASRGPAAAPRARAPCRKRGSRAARTAGRRPAAAGCRAAPRAHSAAAAAFARSAAAAPRSAPRRCGVRSTFWISARSSSVVAEQALGVRLLEVVRVEHQQHVLLDAVPAARRVTRSEATSSWPGPREPVQLEEAEPVGVQLLAVGEEEVEAGEGRALDGRGASSRAGSATGSPSSKSCIRRLKRCSESVSPSGAAHAGLEQPAGSGGSCRCGRTSSCPGRTGACSRARSSPIVARRTCTLKMRPRSSVAFTNSPSAWAASGKRTRRGSAPSARS